MPCSNPSSCSTDLCVNHSNILSTISPKRNSGRKKFRETRHPIYKGIRQRKGAKWVCEMRLNNGKTKSRLWLGTHISPEMAARAYDIAALALKGKSAQLNFPDSAWLLTRAKSSSIKDIQSAALVAAHAFRPTAANSSSTSTSVMLPHVRRTNALLENSATMFFDEEAIFNMPCLLANMAEGMLLTPPSIQQQESSWDNMYIDYDMDLSLWSV